VDFASSATLNIQQFFEGSFGDITVQGGGSVYATSVNDTQNRNVRQWTIDGSTLQVKENGGTTIVSNGTLLVNGTHTGGGDYAARSGVRLGGTGSIGAAVNVNGSLTPGENGVGTMTINGNLTWNGAANATAAVQMVLNMIEILLAE